LINTIINAAIRGATAGAVTWVDQKMQPARSTPLTLVPLTQGSRTSYQLFAISDGGWQANKRRAVSQLENPLSAEMGGLVS
jgi:hypothetical protein